MKSEQFRSLDRDKYLLNFMPVVFVIAILTKDGLLPGIQYPRVPGHEIADVIEALGRDEFIPHRTGFGRF